MTKDEVLKTIAEARALIVRLPVQEADVKIGVAFDQAVALIERQATELDHLRQVVAAYEGGLL